MLKVFSSLAATVSGVSRCRRSGRLTEEQPLSEIQPLLLFLVPFLYFVGIILRLHGRHPSSSFHRGPSSQSRVFGSDTTVPALVTPACTDSLPPITHP